MLAVGKVRLFVAKEDVGAQTGWVVPEGGIGSQARAVEVDTAVEFEQDVFGRTIGARQDGDGAAFDHRHGRAVSQIGWRGPGGKASVVQPVRVEIFVPVAAVLARDRDLRNLLAVLVERDGTCPQVGLLGGAVAKNEITARRNDDGGQVAGGDIEVAHERAVRTARVLVQPGITRKTGRNAARLTGHRVVVHHHDHGDLAGGRAAAGRAVRVAVVAALEGKIIAVGPEALLQAAGEVIVDFQDVRDTRVAELSEIMRVGVPRESAARFAKGLGFVVAVGINEPHALAGHVESMLPFLLRGKVAVVAVGVGHAHALGEPAGSGRIETLQAGTGIAESAVEFRAEVVVDQTHARVPVAPVAGWLAEVLAEKKGVIARLLVFENGIAVVGVAETTGAVELPLRPAEISGIAGVLACSRLLAEEEIRHVLDRVETESVGLGAIDRPTRRANQVGADVLHESPTVGQNVCAGFEADLFIRRPGTQLGPRLIEQDPEISRVAVLVFVILSGTFEVADERKLRVGRAFRWSEVCVGCLVRDVDQVGQSQVLHLPGAAPIAGIVPLAVEAVFGHQEVKILRHHAGI